MSPLRRCCAIAVVVCIWLFAPACSQAEGEATGPTVHHGEHLPQSEPSEHGPLRDHAGDEHWEGSPAGKTYSERNHWLAGILLLLIGFGEWQTVRGDAPGWMGGLVPAALLASGAFLLIWSDHDAWPIGSMSLRDTLFGGDPEIVQHKLFGLISLVVGGIEAGRRSRRLSSGGWELLLPAFAIVGGFMLLAHHHGPHPSAHQIAQHHTLMAGFAIAAGLAKLLAIGCGSRVMPGLPGLPRRFDCTMLGTRLWAGLVMMVGLLLVLYRE